MALILLFAGGLIAGLMLADRATVYLTNIYKHLTGEDSIWPRQ